MAQKLEAFPEGANSREGYSRYPWNEWLDGDAWELEQGADFTVTTKSFRSAAAQAARIRNGGIRTALTNEGKNVVIQFVPKADTQHAEDAEDLSDGDDENSDEKSDESVNA